MPAIDYLRENTSAQEVPTMHLRYNYDLRLQQMWSITVRDRTGRIVREVLEWRDVPVAGGNVVLVSDVSYTHDEPRE